MNILVKELMKKMGYIEIGKNSKYYSKLDRLKYSVQEDGNYDMHVWRGFKTSIAMTLNEPLLQVDFTSRILRSDSALDLYKQFRDEK
jgi:hypothetical protein